HSQDAPVARPESVRNSQALPGNSASAPVPVVTSATPQAKTRTTVVRTAVARFELMPSTPTLARIAVSPAQTADKIAHDTQLMLGSSLFSFAGPSPTNIE